jgi:hypothetical protein
MGVKVGSQWAYAPDLLQEISWTMRLDWTKSIT